jgi:hypothetical protein
MAQVAITALSMDQIYSVHWTAAAFFVSSLMAGLLAVYTAFIVLSTLNNLTGAQQIRGWLTMPVKPSGNDADANGSDNSSHPPSTSSKKASLGAALVVSCPIDLLSLSLVCLIIGIGIYFGCIYGYSLSTGWGNGGALGILVFYCLTTILGLGESSFPDWVDGYEVGYHGAMEEIRAMEETSKATAEDRRGRDPTVVEEIKNQEAFQDTRPVYADVEAASSYGIKGPQDGDRADSMRSELDKMFQAYLQSQEESQRLGRELLLAYSQIRIRDSQN